MLTFFWEIHQSYLILPPIYWGVYLSLASPHPWNIPTGSYLTIANVFLTGHLVQGGAPVRERSVGVHMTPISRLDLW